MKVVFGFFVISVIFLIEFSFCEELVKIFDLENGVECGRVFCKATEYCKEFSQICKSCEDICDEKHHNWDLDTCNKDCQQYQKIKYLEALKANYTELRDEIRYNHNHVTSEIQRLSVLISVFIGLFCILFVILSIYLLVKCLRWRKRKNITLAWISDKILHKKKSENHTQSVAVTNSSGKVVDLRLEMPDSALHMGNSTPATASTTISSVRRPTEDSPLDYAYDNPAMATTPSPNRPNRTPPTRPHESQL